MKLKKLLVMILGGCIIFSNYKAFYESQAPQPNLNDFNQQVMRLANRKGKSVDVEDPNEVFSLAIDYFNEVFDNYIDVTAMNVSDKDSVNLPNFDINYIPPSFEDVTYSYYENIESCFTSFQLESVDNYRSSNLEFDSYINAIKSKFTDAETNQILIDKYAQDSYAVATASLVSILIGAGLKQSAIAAITGSVSTLSTAVSTSWIPFIGWVLAVALAVAAIVTITVVIVQYWDQICSVFNEIKEWFLRQFDRFGALISQMFGDVEAKVYESNKADKVVIGKQEIDFYEISTSDVATLSKVQRSSLRKKGKVFLMQYVKAKTFQIALFANVNYDFCVRWKTHKLGFSSYTWYQNTARSLILHAGTGLTTIKPELHCKTHPNTSIYMKHFHNCFRIRDNIIKYEEDELGRSHSFFGLFYFWDGQNQLDVLHKDNVDPLEGL